VTTDLEHDALVSYRDDVRAVARELATCTDTGRFADLLAELIELASTDTFVSRRGDKLVVGSFLISVERQ
jgi:hypothetical protein